MNMRLGISETFVVEFQRMHDGVDRLGHRAKLVGQRERLDSREQEQFTLMMLREQDAVAAIELRVAQDHIRMIELRDEVGKLAGADSLDGCADAALRWFRHCHLPPAELRPV